MSKNKYEWNDNMREISGFGGGYEQMCRNMLTESEVKRSMDITDEVAKLLSEYAEINGTHLCTAHVNMKTKTFSIKLK